MGYAPFAAASSEDVTGVFGGGLCRCGKGHGGEHIVEMICEMEGPRAKIRAASYLRGIILDLTSTYAPPSRRELITVVEVVDDLWNLGG